MAVAEQIQAYIDKKPTAEEPAEDPKAKVKDQGSIGSIWWVNHLVESPGEFTHIKFSYRICTFLSRSGSLKKATTLKIQLE